MSLLTRRQQVCAKVGTAGTAPTWSTVEDAANAAFLIYEPSSARNQTLVARNPNRAQIGSLAGIPASVSGTHSFTCELKGSGTAGVAPKIGPLLRACGMSETINAGSAAVGTLIRDPSFSTGTVSPSVAGTFTGLLSGRLVIEVITVTLNTSVEVQATFYPGDGTAPASDNFTQSSGAAVTLTGVADGVTFDFGDPSSATAGIAVGDRFIIPLTSSAQASVTYKMLDDMSTSPVVDISTLQDGRAKRTYSCRGNCDLAFAFDDFAKAAFTMQGIPVADADVAILSGIAYETTVPVPFMNLTGTVLFTENPAPCFSAAAIAFNNDVQMRQCVVGHESGFKDATITSRAMTMEIDPESQLVAAVDFYALQRAGTEGVVQFTIGTVAGNIIDIVASKAQITNITQADRTGDIIDGLSLQLNQPMVDAGSGFSEISITFR